MWKVLVTRPRLFAESLCAKISDWGAQPILFPTIEIHPTLNPELSRKACEIFPTCDWAIFTSRPAVLYGIKALHSMYTVLPKINFAAIGESTANELLNRGIENVVFPKTLPYESETLLALPEFQQMKNKRVIIFRGNGGRTLLPDTLKKRGAQVTLCETYRRETPTFSHFEYPDVILITSPQSLIQLKTLVSEKVWQGLQLKPFITVGCRTYNLSATLGINHRLLAKGAEDDTLIHALTTLRNTIQ